MTFQVVFEVEVDPTIGTMAELEDWVSFSLHENGAISSSNPFLVAYGDVDAVPFSVQVRTH